MRLMSSSAYNSITVNLLCADNDTRILKTLPSLPSNINLHTGVHQMSSAHASIRLHLQGCNQSSKLHVAGRTAAQAMQSSTQCTMQKFTQSAGAAPSTPAIICKNP
jgi:hypothetical protein